MRAIKIYRVGHFFYKHGMRRISLFFDALNHILHNSYIPSSCEIGKETKFAYRGIGVVIHYKAKIGKHCTIGQGVTIGGKNGKVPVIEDNVYIGPGVRILGDVRIGHDSIIGANAVVVKDVDPYSVVAGIPAKKIAVIDEKNYKNKYKSYYGPQRYIKN